MSKKYALWIMVALGVYSHTATAGMDKLMNEMYLATATTPQAVRTQSLHGIAGGSLTLKAPVKAINLIGISKPELRFGCNGISFYGGSFSVINKDEIIAIFRQVVANAAGYAMELAFSTLCNGCWGVVTHQLEKLQKATSEMKNTCAMAKWLMAESGADVKIKSWGDQLAAATCVGEGNCDDHADATAEITNNPDKVAAENAKGNTIMGNSVFMALNKTQAYKRIGYMKPNDIATLVISLTGTYVYSPDEESDGTTESKPKHWTPRLTYAAFIDPSGENEVYVCKSGDIAKTYTDDELQKVCLDFEDNATLQKDLFGGFNGITNMVQDKLTEIVEAITANPPVDVSNNPDLNGFIDAMPTGTFDAMTLVKDNASSLRDMMKQVRPYVVNDIADAIFTEVDHMVSRMLLTKKDYVIPEGVKELQQEIRKRRRERQTNYSRSPGRHIIEINAILNRYKMDMRAKLTHQAAQNTRQSSQ